MAVLDNRNLADEKAELNEAELVSRNNQVIDHDRDTFLPRPSDDPKDPLNWSLSLKVCVAYPLSGSCASRNTFSADSCARSLS